MHQPTRRGDGRARRGAAAAGAAPAVDPESALQPALCRREASRLAEAPGAPAGMGSVVLAATGGSATRSQRVSARRCRRLHSVVRLDVATDAAPPCLAAGGPVDDDWRRGGAPRARRCGRGWHSRPRPPAGPQGLLRRRRAVAPGRVRGHAARVVAAPLADGAASLSPPTPRRGGPFASPSTPTPPSMATTDRASSDW